MAIKSINKEFLKSSSKDKKEKDNKKIEEDVLINMDNPEKKKVMQEFAILK